MGMNYSTEFLMFVSKTHQVDKVKKMEEIN